MVSLQPALNPRNPSEGLTMVTSWEQVRENTELGSFHPVPKPSKTKSLLQPPPQAPSPDISALPQLPISPHKPSGFVWRTLFLLHRLNPLTPPLPFLSPGEEEQLHLPGKRGVESTRHPPQVPKLCKQTFSNIKKRLHCPGFGWDRVNFLPSSWYSAVLWIQYENNVDNTLVFLLLLSSAYSKSRTFQLPMVCQ